MLVVANLNYRHHIVCLRKNAFLEKHGQDIQEDATETVSFEPVKYGSKQR
jgi:hypothetical protein